MKVAIKELGSLCKMAAELEQKWDRCGKDYLDTRMTNAEYTQIVREYLGSVRRLEAALSRHLVTITAEVADSGRVRKLETVEQDELNPA